MKLSNLWRSKFVQLFLLFSRSCYCNIFRCHNILPSKSRVNYKLCLVCLSVSCHSRMRDNFLLDLLANHDSTLYAITGKIFSSFLTFTSWFKNFSVFLSYPHLCWTWNILNSYVNVIVLRYTLNYINVMKV